MIIISIIITIIQVVLILTGLNSALWCEKQSELYRDRQQEKLHFLVYIALNSALCCESRASYTEIGNKKDYISWYI